MTLMKFLSLNRAFCIIQLILTIFTGVLGEICRYYSYYLNGYFSYTYYFYCSTGCCGYYYDEYCCTDYGSIVGSVAGAVVCVVIIIIIAIVVKKHQTRQRVTHVMPAQRGVNVVRTSNQQQMGYGGTFGYGAPGYGTPAYSTPAYGTPLYGGFHH